MLLATGAQTPIGDQIMKGITYSRSNTTVQPSFQYSSHENLTVTTVANTSGVLHATEIMLSLVVAAHVRIGAGDATTADMVLPAGVWPLVVEETDTISVLQLTGSVAGQASVIKVER